VIGSPSRLRLIRKTVALASKFPLFDLRFARTPRGESFFVYYESMKRKLKIKPIYECRCNRRLQTKRFTRLAHTGLAVKVKNKEGRRKKKYIWCKAPKRRQANIREHIKD
jgi:hypothetical protein